MGTEHYGRVEYDVVFGVKYGSQEGQLNMRIRLAVILAVIAALALFSFASAASITLTERETKAGVEKIVYDDQTDEVNVYLNGELIETRAATEREIQAAAAQAKDVGRKQAIDDLRSSVADIKGRPLVDVNSRLDRIEAALIDLAAAIGVE